MRYRSRLSRRIERQTKRTFLLSLFGIIVTIFLIIKLGIPLLANFSLFVAGLKGQTDTPNKQNSVFVSSPVLHPLPNATNSATLAISGKANPKEKVKLFVNGELADEKETEKDGSFSFERVQLSAGQNTIKTKALTEENKESDFSEEMTVVFKKDPPLLTLDAPKDEQTFSKDENVVQVLGKTDPGVKITVNQFWAIVDEQGNFSYSLTLQNGENTIKVVAVDEAGNKTEVERKVNYSP